MMTIMMIIVMTIVDSAYLQHNILPLSIKVTDHKILQNDWLRFDKFGAAVRLIIDCVTASSDVRELSREVEIALFNLRNFVAEIVSISICNYTYLCSLVQELFGDSGNKDIAAMLVKYIQYK